MLISNPDIFLVKHFRMFKILEIMYLAVIQIQLQLQLLLLYRFRSIWKLVYKIMTLLTSFKEFAILFMVIEFRVIGLVISIH
jgi:hypothetical protein